MTELVYELLGGERHRHETMEHAHPHRGPHTHSSHDHRRSHEHHHDHGHGHSHRLIDPSIKRSREGVRAVLLALLVLGLAAAAQIVVYLASGSIALLADLIHNVGDAATAIPLGIAFLLRSQRAERWAGLAVVAAIFISACVAGYEAVDRLINPQDVQLARGDHPHPRRAPARQPRADRRRSTRPRRRLRLARRHRQRPRRRDRDPDRRPADRPRDHCRHPAHHLGLLAHRPPRTPARVSAHTRQQLGRDVLIRGLSMTRPDDDVLALSGPLYDGLYEYLRRAAERGPA